ncbi:MAG: hypothetical protein AAF903_04645 [Pseudomonadota bacterium]
MLESGLFFTLGFLCSLLLALMVAPAIWRRAVVLTRQRIESSVPLTLNEIQADKDQLRAEFAMSTRRLELSLEGLKERAAEQLIEINRRRDEMLLLEEQENRKTARIADLEAQANEMRTEMKIAEDKLAQTDLDLAATQAKLEERALAYENLETKYQQTVDEFDGRKIEMVARETRIDAEQDSARENREKLKALEAEKRATTSEMKELRAKLAKEKKRAEGAEEKIAKLQTQLADMEIRLERRDSDLTALRAKSGNSSSEVSRLQKTLDKTLAEKVKLEAELSDAALRTEALLKDASEENVENAIASFESDRRRATDRITELEKERDALKVELSTMQMASGEDWELERRENAIVRERINDLAAQVTAMTAALEGPDSPINQALGKQEGVFSKVKGKGKPKIQVETLADRIRALQAATEKA